jgi:5-methylcytosine-specific restriction endonuclease McrA
MRRDSSRRNSHACLQDLTPYPQPFSLEHLIPRSQGGHTSLDNLALACQGCTNHKYNKTKSGDPVSSNWLICFILAHSVGGNTLPGMNVLSSSSA